MSYATIATSATDSALARRVTASLAQEGVGAPDPSTALVSDYMWRLSSASDIEAAYASALAAGNENPGGDEAVITDGMILAFVQANPPTPLPVP